MIHGFSPQDEVEEQLSGPGLTQKGKGLVLVEEAGVHVSGILTHN